jgi:hypothetical protein
MRNIGRYLRGRYVHYNGILYLQYTKGEIVLLSATKKISLGQGMKKQTVISVQLILKESRYKKKLKPLCDFGAVVFRKSYV